MDQLVDEFGYTKVASEYYDRRHITSRNFEDATEEFFSNLFLLNKLPNGWVLEVGAGKGRTNEYLGVSPDRIIQLDLSREMLQYRPREAAQARVQADAKRLPFCNNTIELVTAFLFDAFNVKSFYDEVSRVLKNGGIFIGSLPHYEWGTQLRPADNQDRAVFDLKNGSSVAVPSKLLPESVLREYCEQAGLTIYNMWDLTLSADIETISKDITAPAHDADVSPYDLPIVKLLIVKENSNGR